MLKLFYTIFSFKEIRGEKKNMFFYWFLFLPTYLPILALFLSFYGLSLLSVSFPCSLWEFSLLFIVKSSSMISFHLHWSRTIVILPLRKQTVLLSYNSYTIQFTHSKCTMPEFLLYLQSCAIITTINFRIFSPEKHSVPISSPRCSIPNFHSRRQSPFCFLYR